VWFGRVGSVVVMGVWCVSGASPRVLGRV
jgi:hypothetical protein